MKIVIRDNLKSIENKCERGLPPQGYLQYQDKLEINQLEHQFGLLVGLNWDVHLSCILAEVH